MHFAHTWANIKNIKPVIIQKHRKKYQVLEISSFVLKLSIMFVLSSSSKFLNTVENTQSPYVISRN